MPPVVDVRIPGILVRMIKSDGPSDSPNVERRSIRRSRQAAYRDSLPAPTRTVRPSKQRGWHSHNSTGLCFTPTSFCFYRIGSRLRRRRSRSLLSVTATAPVFDCRTTRCRSPVDSQSTRSWADTTTDLNSKREWALSTEGDLGPENGAGHRDSGLPREVVGHRDRA